MTHLVQAPAAALIVAEPDRRFYAFAVDRLIAWVLYAAAGVGAWALFLRHDRVLLGIVLIGVVVLAVWFVGSLMTGLAGATPGKSLFGLKVVGMESGRPVGLAKALLRQAVLGVATLPTLGIGTSTLAWVASVDGTGHRRGWHDTLAGTVVVDVRPQPEAPPEEAPAPRRVVNLTAMRLMPAPQAAEPTATPARRESTFTGSHPIQLRPLSVPGGATQGVPPAPSAPAAPASPPAPRPAPPVQPATPTQPLPQMPQPPTPASQRPAPSPAPTPPPPAQTPKPPAPAQPAGGVPQAPRPTPAPQARWRVSFDTGESFVVSGLALVGRGPEPRPGEQVSHLVALTSHDMSLSKTHAQFQVVPDGALVVMDRGSTNGTTLIRQGAARPLGARKPATLVHGDRVRFGDREMKVVREA